MLYKIIAISCISFISCTAKEEKKETIAMTDTVTIRNEFPDLMNMDSLHRSRAERSDTIAHIDSMVKAIDSNDNLNEYNFSITALKKVLHILTYSYWTGNDEVKKIRRQFSYKKDTVVQVFYLHKKKLIYASETITTYFIDPKDSIGWSGGFYFDNDKLIDHTTLGHGKSESEDWDPENYMQKLLGESLRDIRRWKAGGGR